MLPANMQASKNSVPTLPANCCLALALLWAAAGYAAAPAEGRLLLEAMDGKVETRDAVKPGELHFAANGTVFLRYEGPRPERVKRIATVALFDGQRWCGEVAGGAGDNLRWKTALGPELALSVDHITRIEFEGRIAAVDQAALAAAPEGDRLYWVHGDALERVDGTFESFAKDGVELSSVLGKRTFPWSEVGALFFAPLQSTVKSEAPQGAPVIVDLIDGSRLRAGFMGVGEHGLLLAYSKSEPLQISCDQLLEAALDDGSFSYLSSLPPTRVQEGSLFGDELGLRWPHREDLSVVGSELCVAGALYSRGLGVHAPSRLEWSLSSAAGTPLQTGSPPAAKAPRELTGSVGIDDSVRATSARGSVRFQVFVDGALRWDSGVVRGGEPARAMPRIDLRGAKELALVVDPSEDSFVADRADWLRLILIREP